MIREKWIDMIVAELRSPLVDTIDITRELVNDDSGNPRLVLTIVVSRKEYVENYGNLKMMEDDL